MKKIYIYLYITSTKYKHGDPFPVVFLARDMTHVFYKKLVDKKLVLKMDEMLRNCSAMSDKYFKKIFKA